jgi:hypothetical protein
MNYTKEVLNGALEALVSDEKRTKTRINHLKEELSLHEKSLKDNEIKQNEIRKSLKDQKIRDSFPVDKEK